MRLAAMKAIGRLANRRGSAKPEAVADGARLIRAVRCDVANMVGDIGETMAAFDVLIKGAEVFSGDGPGRQADVCITGDRIAAVVPSLPTDQTRKTVEAAGLILCPGFIDTATFEDPKQVPSGVDRVLVAGSTVWEEGAHTKELPGGVVREPPSVG